MGVVIFSDYIIISSKEIDYKKNRLCDDHGAVVLLMCWEFGKRTQAETRMNTVSIEIFGPLGMGLNIQPRNW